MKPKKLLVTLLSLAVAVPMAFVFSVKKINADKDISDEGDVAINSTNFPDKNFRTFVKDFDENCDNILSKDELEGVTEMFCESLEIKDLTGIGYFTKLENLYCGYNEITKLDVGILPELKVLSCAGDYSFEKEKIFGKLSSLDVSKNSNLTTLNITGNKIEKIDISKNTKLKELSAQWTKITSVDLSNNTALVYVDFCFTPLQSIDVSMLPDLETLDVSCNYDLQKIDVTSNPNLNFLSCSWTSVGNVDVSKNPKLENLYLYSCGLTKLSVSHNPELKYLDCGYCQLEHIDLSHNPELISFSASWAGLHDLDVSHNPKLEHLEIFGNGSGMYVGNGQMNKLDLSNNPELQYLDCNSCTFESLDLSHNPKLYYVDIAGNEIGSIKVDHMKDLEYLDCSFVNLKELDVTKNTKLRELYLQYNDLTELDLTKNKSLEKLNLQLNLFQEMPKNYCKGEVTYEPQRYIEPITNLSYSRKGYTISLSWDEAEHADMYQVFRSEDGDAYEHYVECYEPNFVDEDCDPTVTYYYMVFGEIDLSDLGYENARGEEAKIEVGPLITPTPAEPTPAEPTPAEPTPIEEPEDPSFEDFVERLYVVALGRASEEAGKKFWVDKVVSGEYNGADCARYFLLEAPEFMNRNLSVDDFVETLYKTFFDRESDAAGKTGWVDAINTGKMTRAIVVENFIESTEWCNVCATYGVKSGAKYHKAEFASKNAINFATRLYTCCLGRDPEEKGLKYWSLALTNLEQTGCSAAKEFFNSTEFTNLNLKDDEYIRRLYTTFMDREPEASEVAYWAGEIAGGTQTRASVLAFFGSSEEFTKICKSYGIDRGEI